ncbi:MAG: hypothetical protein ABMA00_17855, partial [Gemmatimonas sp.]
MTHHTSRVPLVIALLASAVLTVGACRKGGDTIRVDSAAVALRAPIADSAKGPGVREGVWEGADVHSSWRAILDGPWITQVDEIVLFTDSARATRQFHFDSSGFLAKAREERTQVLFGSKAIPDTLHTILDLEWQRDSLLRSAKHVNGVARLVQPY